MTWTVRLFFASAAVVATIMEALLGFGMLAGGHGPSVALRITLGPENVVWFAELVACFVGMARFRVAKVVSATLCSVCIVVWIADVASKWDILINWLGNAMVSASLILWGSVILFKKSIVILLIVSDIRSLSFASTKLIVDNSENEYKGTGR